MAELVGDSSVGGPFQIWWTTPDLVGDLEGCGHFQSRWALPELMRESGSAGQFQNWRRIRNMLGDCKVMGDSRVVWRLQTHSALLELVGSFEAGSSSPIPYEAYVQGQYRKMFRETAVLVALLHHIRS